MWFCMCFVLVLAFLVVTTEGSISSLSPLQIQNLLRTWNLHEPFGDQFEQQKYDGYAVSHITKDVIDEEFASASPIHRMVLWNRIKELRKGINLPNHRMLKATAGGAKPDDTEGGKQEAEDKLYTERISALPKRDDFLGVQIERDNAQVVMGAKQDVQLLRLQNGTLTIVAPHVNVVTKSFLVNGESVIKAIELGCKSEGFECSAAESYNDFTWGSKYGLKFQRVHNVNNDALKNGCDIWGYVGGSLDDNNHKSYRVSGRNAAFTQPSNQNQQQDIEFNFCEARTITYVKMWPLHKGHQFTRGTLQYRKNGEWVSVSSGKGVLVDTKWPGSLRMGNAWEISNSEKIAAKRWRVHNWRTEGNQRVDGIDLKMQSCSEKFTGLACAQECTSDVVCKKASQLKDFVWGDKNGMKFKRVKGSSNDILGKGSCGSWGYAGGTLDDRNHKSNRISSRNAVFLQEHSKTEQQDIEFFFCKDTVIQTAQVFPLHSGHELLRGTLQYFKDGKWLNLKAGKQHNTATGKSLFMDNTDTVYSKRWRIHDWRTEDNQRLDGIDLSILSCEENLKKSCKPVQPCTSVGEVCHDSLNQDFTWGDKYGLTFKRTHGPSDNALGGGKCNSWGYVGGRLDDVNHASSRISSRKAVFTQASSKNEMQDIEFFFCKERIIKSAKMWPLHSGHNILRGTLQYREFGSWKTVAVGKAFSSKQGQGIFTDNTNGKIKAKHWRIHDWRSGDNQRMDGIDLVVADCEEEFEGSCPKKCTKTLDCGVDSALSDFTWGDKYGLKFQRVEGPSNNALVSCDRWGYVGGRLNDVNHGSNRISSRKAVFTQASSKNEMQDVEFHFCNAVVVKFAKMWPLHGGHSFQRGTLQYRGKDNQWHTAAPGALVGTKYGTAVEMKNSNTDIVAHRWRLHNWRTGDNQRVDGIDLVISTCLEIQKNC